MKDKEFIKSLVEDIEIDDETSSFLLRYLSAWMNNTGIDINADTIKLINANKDIIDKLKLIYSKEKIIDYTERKIILSEIAKGEKKIEQPKITKNGIEYTIVEPSFNERIQAINALNALDAIDNIDTSDRIIIIDNINEENAVYEKDDDNE